MGTRQESAVRELLALFFAPDIAEVLDDVASHFTEAATYQPLVPLGPVARGRAAIVDDLARQAKRYKECHCQIERIASTDDLVFTERTDTVTMLADGRQVVVRVNAVFELDANVQVAAWREYWDAADVARQLGLAAEDLPVVAG